MACPYSRMVYFEVLLESNLTKFSCIFRGRLEQKRWVMISFHFSLTLLTKIILVCEMHSNHVLRISIAEAQSSNFVSNVTRHSARLSVLVTKSFTRRVNILKLCLSLKFVCVCVCECVCVCVYRKEYKIFLKAPYYEQMIIKKKHAKYLVGKIEWLWNVAYFLASFSFHGCRNSIYYIK